MAKLKDLAIKGAGDRLLFDLDMIHEKEGYNVRDMESAETQAHIRKMADAIKENGTDAFPEITVFQDGDKVYVHRGHCRLRAHKLAKAEGAPVIGIRVIAAPKQNDAEHALDMLNSNDGLALTPMEQAVAVGRLLKFEWSPDMIAKKRGCSVTAIKNLMKLLEAPEEVKDMVKNGAVSARTATDVIAKEGAEKGTETLKEAVQEAKASGKEKATPKHVKKAAAKKDPEPPAGSDTVPATGTIVNLTTGEQHNTGTDSTPAADAKTTATKGAQPAGEPNWNVWGPRMRKMLTRLRDAESPESAQHIYKEIGPFLKNMAVNPKGI